jgi:hypothetical protein
MALALLLSLLGGQVLLPRAALAIPKRDDNRELHVVGIYEGVERTGDQIHGGRATVTVDRPGRKVTLILAAASSVTWEVKPTRNTTIERVFIGGYEPQAIKDLPGADIVKAFRESGSKSILPYFGYKVDSPRFRALVDQLSDFTDLEISSFHGTYAYKHETPIVVDSVQDDPRLLRNFPQPTPLAELPQMLFPAVHYQGDPTRPFSFEAARGDFTLDGPQMETLQPLPKNVQRLAYDHINKNYYGIAGHDAVQVDLKAAKTTKMDVGFDVPRLSWPADITFDSKRSRLLLVTSGGGGYLYSYDIGTKSWSALAEKIGVANLVYHSKHDCLYGIAVHHSEDGGKPALRQFNNHGALINETPLGAPVMPRSFSPGPGPNGTQLIAVDEHVVAIASPHGLRSSEGRGTQRTYIYLIEPKKGQVWLTWKHPK